MKNSGKFLAKVTVFGGAMDSKGNIISRDNNGLPPVWLSPLAGSIPNRNTLTGSVAARAGILMDENGVIGRGATGGTSFAFRLIFGQYNLVGKDDRYGDQYTFTILQDLTEAPNVAREILELETMLGAASIFTVERPELPEGYQKKSNQHVSERRLDPNYHSVLANDSSNPVRKALNDLGPQKSDDGVNENISVNGMRDSQGNPRTQHNPI